MLRRLFGFSSILLLVSRRARLTQSEEEAELSRRSATCPMPVRVEVSGISPSTPPPTAPASALSSPADNGSTPAVAEPTDKGAHHVVLEAITGATKGDGINQSGRNGSGNAVERASAAEPTSAGDDKGSKVAVRVGVGGDRGSAKAQEKDAVVAGDSTAPANGMTVIKVPVESLDPELYCLTAVSSRFEGAGRGDGKEQRVGVELVVAFTVHMCASFCTVCSTVISTRFFSCDGSCSAYTAHMMS